VVSAAFVHLFNAEAHGRNRTPKYFRGKSEQEILDYMQNNGLWNGKDDITFFGERPLGGPDGVFIRFNEGSNINVLHEHAFGIENGRLVNRGYTGDVLGVDMDPVLSGGDYSSYVFSKTVYQGSLSAAVNQEMSGGGWAPSDYGLLRHTCQDFADAVRGTFGP
jgi:hypothetical protein